MKVYIAGASKEITRAEHAARMLITIEMTSKIEIVSTWPGNIRAVGAANPTNRSVEQYREWAWNIFDQLRAAHVLWCLLPSTETVGMAWIDAGAGKKIVMSGPHRPIFTPPMAHFHSDYDTVVAGYLRRRAAASGNFPETSESTGEGE